MCILVKIYNFSFFALSSCNTGEIKNQQIRAVMVFVRYYKPFRTLLVVSQAILCTVHRDLCNSLRITPAAI